MFIEGFICFEGIDGSGKSTQVKLLDELDLFPINNKGDRSAIITTREPTAGAAGKLIREVLTRKSAMGKVALEYLWAADRQDHISFIQKQIEENNIVITDRYYYSGMAYADDSAYEVACQLSKPFPIPEYLVYLDLKPEVAMDRFKERGEANELYENVEKLTSVYNRYETALKDAESRGVKVIRIDATQSIKDIHKEIRERIQYFNYQ